MQISEIDQHIDQHTEAPTTEPKKGKINLKTAWFIAKPILQFLDNTVLALRPKWQIAVKDLITAIDDYINASALA